MPFSCAASSASAICSAIRSASSIGIAPTLQPFGQRLTFDQFHDQEVLAVRFLHAVERGDVWMVDRREHLRFALESRDAIRIGSEGVEDDFDGDAATELAVACAIDFAHATSAEHVRDLVRAEPGA